jgi:iron-sulfur cluster assembly protein
LPRALPVRPWAVLRRWRGPGNFMTTVTEQSAKAPQTAPAKGIQVTDKALGRVKSAMAKEGISPEQGGLRLGVQGGGCSGLSYNVRFDTQPRERDRIFQFGDVRVFVDPKSFIYLHGMILDYQETLLQQGFVFVNPQATKSCGCGTSFSA